MLLYIYVNNFCIQLLMNEVVILFNEKKPMGLKYSKGCEFLEKTMDLRN